MLWHASSLQLLLLLLLLLPSQSAKLRTPGLLGPAAAAVDPACTVPNIGLLAALVLALAAAAAFGVTTASAAALPSSASLSSCAEVVTAHAM
jgi:hypothetical protein